MQKWILIALKNKFKESQREHHLQNQEWAEKLEIEKAN